jgi:hypothetical protein
MKSLKFIDRCLSRILGTGVFILKVALPASVTECSAISITNFVVAPEVVSRPALDSDQPGVVSFFGSDAAALFTREISESYRGVLSQDYFSKPEEKYPLGFLQASPSPQPWSGTMWSRDSGVFLRELIHWGYFTHACEVANCLINFSGTNAEGFVAFPEYFRPGDVNKTGAEIDGQAAIIIAMVNLWQELPDTNAFRARLYDFLNRTSSPVRYFHYVLETESLIPGKNEFGGGCGVPGYYDNVVQNNLAALALLISAEMEEKAGDTTTANVWRHDAIKIRVNMEKYLVDADGSWLWCIDPKTLKPDWAILNENINEGFGGLNGVACMYSDVLGFEPLASHWPGIEHCQRTFEKLYAYPSRRLQFEKFGFWSQFDIYRGGLSSGPSYGEGYALQTMLLFDKLGMAGKSLSWLANTTYKAEGIDFRGQRHSPYYFYERTYSPEARGKMNFEVGCGALNLVSVTEPLKVARLIVGVDDTSTAELKILPRVPPSWSGYEASNWPMFTGGTVIRANLRFKKSDRQAVFSLKLSQGERIPSLAVRMPSKSGWFWERAKDISDIEFRSQMQ